MTEAERPAQRLAERALALQRRLSLLPDDVDPSWLERWPAFELPGSPRPPVIGAVFFQQVCGSLPALSALDGPHGSLVVLPSRELRSRLVAIAIAGRPGVMRSCVLRHAREALEMCLGSAFAPLASLGAASPTVHAACAHLSPAAWAWVGWRELERSAPWPTRSLRRLARLGLPAPWSAVGQRALPGVVPAPVSSVHSRLALLPALFGEVGRPC